MMSSMNEHDLLPPKLEKNNINLKPGVLEYLPNRNGKAVNAPEVTFVKSAISFSP